MPYPAAAQAINFPQDETLKGCENQGRGQTKAEQGLAVDIAE
jgi:hypothetical protein